VFQELLVPVHRQGGHEGRPVDARTLAVVVEKFGAGEILPGTDRRRPPSGHRPIRRGQVEHFSEVFEATDVKAAFAAGIFHRKEMPFAAVKEHTCARTG